MPLATCPVVVLVVFISHSLVLDSLAVVQTQHWHPPFVSSREHPRNATQEVTRKGVSGQRHIPCSGRTSPNHRSNSHPNHTHTANFPRAIICKPPYNTHSLDRTVASPSGGTRPEHFRSKHHASTTTTTRGSNLILRTRDRNETITAK
jgi:hypothetical protein